MRIDITLKSGEMGTLDVDFQTLEEFGQHLASNAFFTARWEKETYLYRSSLVDVVTIRPAEEDAVLEKLPPHRAGVAERGITRMTAGSVTLSSGIATNPETWMVD